MTADPPQQFQRVAHKMIARYGESVTLTTYSRTGFDEQGDPEFDSSNTTTSAYFDETFGAHDRRNTQQGSEMYSEIEIWMDDTETSISPLVGLDAEAHPSLTRTETGVEYELRHVSVEGNGLIYCIGYRTE